MQLDVELPNLFNTPEWRERASFKWRVEEHQTWNTKRIYYMHSSFLAFEDSVPTATLEAICRDHNSCVEAMHRHNTEFRKRIQRILNAWRPSLRKFSIWRWRGCDVGLSYDNTVEIADELSALRRMLRERIVIPEHMLQ